MSEGSSLRAKWPYAVTAALFLLVGIDVGMRLSARGDRAPAASPAALEKSAAGSSAAPAKNTVVHRGTPGSDSRPEQAPAPDPAKEAAKSLVERWAAAPDGGPMYATRAEEPPMPRAEGKLAELQEAAERAGAKGDKKGAASLYKDAEDAAAEPRQKEEMRLRRLWILFDLGEMKEVRRLAEEIGAHPVRAESRKIASEVLAKLDSKH